MPEIEQATAAPGEKRQVDRAMRMGAYLWKIEGDPDSDEVLILRRVKRV